MRVYSFSLLLAYGCDSADAPAVSDGPPSSDISYEVVVTGLAVPWAFAFAPDGRVFVTERAGRIRVIERGQLRAEPWATIPVVAEGEAGLMGLALSPDFATDGHVFVVGTFESEGRLINRVLRLTDSAGVSGAPSVVIDNIPAAEFHAGDAITFGPDGMLYIATGDAGNPREAADIKSLAGKILRYTPSGAVPADNPFPGSAVYALGVRNTQGLAWHPDGGQLFSTDHGPSGFPNERFRRNNDELNVIVRGKNFGWPDQAGPGDDARYVDPILTWNPAIAPAGLALYNGPVAEWKGNLFAGALKGQQLERVILEAAPGTATGYRVTRRESLFHEQLGRIRAVVMGPDGSLYFSTSNWDGRGDPREGDDRILRLVPR